MPMPTGGTWPPKHMECAYRAYRDWDAWYAGDPNQLALVYSGRDGQGRELPPSQRTRASQFAGGLVGSLSRWLWGAPPPATSRDSRLHVPVAADLASAAAALLYSEPPALMMSTKPAQARVEEMVAGGLHTALRHAAEACSALGDVYLRPVVDKEVSPKAAIVNAVHADGAIPVLRWGHLVEVTFWSQLSDPSDSVVLRLLEHHEPGRITYALFRGTSIDLGRPVPLQDHPGSKHLAELVDSDSGQDTGLDRLAVVRIPNAGPQRRWRKLPNLKYFGRSDLDGNEPILDRIDAVWTSWMRDINLARGRISVPSYMLQDLGAGQGAYWDADREVYSALNAAPNQASAGNGLTVSQFNIRHVEHKATLDALFETAMRHSGLSSQTLGEEGDVAMTATEAQNRERMSYITRGDRTTAQAPLLADYIELHMTVERINGLSAVDPERPNVEWGDSVSESPETTARTVQLLAAADAASIETRIRIVHPDWDNTEVQQEKARILADRGAGLPGNADPLNSGRAFANADLPADQPPAEGS